MALRVNHAHDRDLLLRDVWYVSLLWCEWEGSRRVSRLCCASEWKMLSDGLQGRDGGNGVGDLSR